MLRPKAPITMRSAPSRSVTRTMALPKPHRFTGEAWDAEVELLVPRRQILPAGDGEAGQRVSYQARLVRRRLDMLSFPQVECGSEWRRLRTHLGAANRAQRFGRF